VTLAMPDSITVGNLPPGYTAYLGYGDGDWPTQAALRARFPQAQLVILTVTGATAAHGAKIAAGDDIEPGDLTPASGAAWLHGQIGQRPVAYASRDTMPSVLGELGQLGVERASVRLLTAHYGAGEHICGPATCKASFQADGTQWTDTYPGTGAPVDMSVLAGDFFAAPASVNAVWPAGVVLREGDTGGAVLVLQRALHDSGEYGARGLEPIDGAFGPVTLMATRDYQNDRHLTVDGIAGPQTRAALGI